MRIFLVLCLVCALTAACATGWQAGGRQSPASTPQPTLEPALASSVLVQRREEGEARYEIRPVDPATGQTVAGVAPVDLGPNISSAFALSVDNTRLAVVESWGQVTASYAGGTSYRRRGDVLHVSDLRTQREVTATLSGEGWVSTLTFSPDSSQLALAYHEPDGSRLMVFDAETERLMAERTLDVYPELLTYTDHGMTLAVYGQARGVPDGIGKPPPPEVLLFDAGTLEPLWQRSLETVLSGVWCLEQCTEQHGRQLFADWQPAMVPAPDGRRLYIVHADEPRLTFVDFDSGTVGSVLIREKQSWLDRLLGIGIVDAKGGVTGATKRAVLSPDGTRLYAAEQPKAVSQTEDGYWEPVETDIEVRVVDVETGDILVNSTLDAPGPYTYLGDIDVMPERGQLLVNGWGSGAGWTQLLDAGTLERTAQMTGWAVTRVQRLDGRPLLMARRWHGEQQTEFAVLDSETLNVVDTWETADASVVTP